MWSSVLFVSEVGVETHKVAANVGEREKSDHGRSNGSAPDGLTRHTNWLTARELRTNLASDRHAQKGCEKARKIEAEVGHRRTRSPLCA
eukprot:740952-Rhodomonas_salina.1